MRSVHGMFPPHPLLPYLLGSPVQTTSLRPSQHRLPASWVGYIDFTLCVRSGHGTFTVGEELVASVAGVVQQVNKLICVQVGPTVPAASTPPRPHSAARATTLIESIQPQNPDQPPPLPHIFSPRGIHYMPHHGCQLLLVAVLTTARPLTAARPPHASASPVAVRA